MLWSGRDLCSLQFQLGQFGAGFAHPHRVSCIESNVSVDVFFVLFCHCFAGPYLLRETQAPCACFAQPFSRLIVCIFKYGSDAVAQGVSHTTRGASALPPHQWWL